MASVIQSLEPRLLLAADWRFIVAGDSRGSDPGGINATIISELAGRAAAEGAKFVVFPGDLVTTGSLSAFQAWKTAWAAAYNANIGLAAVAGNHDSADLADFKTLFISPLQNTPFSGEQNFVLDATAGDQRSYSFNYQNALFLGLDNYLNGSTGTHAVNQAFVDARLAARDRSNTPLIFSFDHEPAFKIGQDTGLEYNVAKRDAFWNSLKNAGSRAFFAGHDHLYVHSQMVDNPSDSNPNNDVHQVVVGTAGAPLYSYQTGGSTGAWTLSDIYHESQYGYLRVDVHNNTVTQTWVHRTGTNTYASTAEVFTYSVNAAPTLDPIPGRSIAKNLPMQAIALTGITAGINDAQSIAISATSSNPAIVPNPTIAYASPNSAGTLYCSPVAGQLGSATITVTVRDAGIDGTLNTADDGLTTRAFTVTIVPPPTVTASGYEYAAAPQTLWFTFDADVGASLAAGDLALTDGAGAPATASFGSFSYNPSTRTAVWTLSSPLADNNYRAVLAAAGIADPVNNALDGNGDGVGGDDYILPFFQLLGDANRDCSVDFIDLVAVAQHYNTPSGATWSIGDFNCDGAVNFIDLVAVSQNYGHALPVPAAPVPSVDQSASTAAPASETASSVTSAIATTAATSAVMRSPVATNPAAASPAPNDPVPRSFPAGEPVAPSVPRVKTPAPRRRTVPSPGGSTPAFIPPSAFGARRIRRLDDVLAGEGPAGAAVFEAER